MSCGDNCKCTNCRNYLWIRPDEFIMVSILHTLTVISSCSYDNIHYTFWLEKPLILRLFWLLGRGSRNLSLDEFLFSVRGDCMLNIEWYEWAWIELIQGYASSAELIEENWMVAVRRALNYTRLKRLMIFRMDLVFEVYLLYAKYYHSNIL